MPPVTLPAGAAHILHEAQSEISPEVAADDGDEERESYESAMEADRLVEAADEDQDGDAAAMDVDEDSDSGESHGAAGVDERKGKGKLTADDVHQTVKLASRDVITAQTLSTFQRNWKSFIKFCVANRFLAEGAALDPRDLPAQLPEYICMWIMNTCDDVDIYTGKKKGPKDEPASYSHAQKMRAAMTHQFGREFGLGQQTWSQSELKADKYTGNPSLSTVVSQYMVSLRRRKVSGLPFAPDLRMF
ncbi:hypothetical protein PsYK624_052700 [Phanerochaete sordida]|uniref:Uncharacterized protein n=1 Tax=Phanerochaete sordida TaxID=48140 RepID=A0A9P3G822_9APHY|nr:hypothetical protein PsYK624_052700 [Phanerochaete sordida]